jgi:hypothetical protein
MKNIVISGCSYSCVHTDKTAPLGYWPAKHRSENISYPNFLRDILNYKLVDVSQSGQSNPKILKDIYENISDEPSLYIVQLTHLHRTGYFCDSLNSWVDLQPYSATMQPTIINELVSWSFNLDSASIEIRNNNGTNLTSSEYHSIIKNLRTSYETNLMLSFNELEEFKYLLFQCDILKSHIKSINSNNKVLFLYWPILSNEMIAEFDLSNFLNIDGLYSIQEWSVKNDLLGMDAHLNPTGHRLLSNYIYDFIDNNLDI